MLLIECTLFLRAGRTIGVWEVLVEQLRVGSMVGGGYRSYGRDSGRPSHNYAHSCRP